MKPPPFAYAAPETLEAALALLAEHGDDAKLLAGGQSLVPLLNFRLARPSLLIDLNRLSDLDFVRRDAAGGLALGALVRHRRLERDPLIAEAAPLLRGAAPHIAHPQIRNRGTLGGSLAHADSRAELPAVMVALEARFRLQRAGGERWIEARDFFLGLLTSDLAADEILTEVSLPPLAPRTGWAFLEVARRHGDYGQAGVAARVQLSEDGTCRQARLVYLSAGGSPLLAERAAALLEGQGPSADLFAAAADEAGREVEPTDDMHGTVAYKRHLARVLTVRALNQAVARVGGEA